MPISTQSPDASGTPPTSTLVGAAPTGSLYGRVVAQRLFDEVGYQLSLGAQLLEDIAIQ
jgi:hypothetical protein